MQTKTFSKFFRAITLFLISLVLVSCINEPAKKPVLSDSIQTNFSNLNINIHNSNIYGTIEFLISSPKEIRAIRLNTDVYHTFHFEQIDFKSSFLLALFLQEIDYSKFPLSKEDQTKYDDVNLLETLPSDLKQSEEVKNYYFYWVGLDIPNRSDLINQETITEMIVTTDQENGLNIGKIDILPSKTILEKNETNSYLIIRNFSEKYGATSGITQNRLYSIDEDIEQPEFEISEDIVIDKITLIDLNMTFEKISLVTQSPDHNLTFSFNNETFNNMNLSLEKNTKFNIEAILSLKDKKDDLLFMQSYDYIIHYHDKNNVKQALIVDSGYIASTKELFFIAANDEIKESIKNYYFNYLPQLRETIPMQ